MPVDVADATHPEALGPPLAALILTTIQPRAGRVILRGDSQHVVELLARATTARDLFLYNCRELTHDALTGWQYTLSWIPREENTDCDRLAVQAAVMGRLHVHSNGPGLRWVPDLVAMCR